MNESWMETKENEHSEIVLQFHVASASLPLIIENGLINVVLLLVSQQSNCFSFVPVSRNSTWHGLSRLWAKIHFRTANLCAAIEAKIIFKIQQLNLLGQGRAMLLKRERFWIGVLVGRLRAVWKKTRLKGNWLTRY